MKTELFEKMIRKIVREELDYYASKIIKEVSEVAAKSLVTENTRQHTRSNQVKFTSDDVSLKQSLMSFKNELDNEYGIGNNSAMKFDGIDVPPELDAVFNKDYSDFMKKLKK
jgi:hypothetical protein